MTEAILWTPRFQESFRKYSGGRQRVIRVVRQAMRRRAEVQNWYDGKRAMQGIDDLVYELKVTHSDRALVHVQQDNLFLVDVGNHEVTDRYAALPAPLRRQHLLEAEAAPEWFRPHTDVPLFLDVDEPYEPAWAEEFGEEWLYFLSDEQSDVKNSLILGLNRAIAGEGASPYVALVKGGAGTGKTALLLSIALDYAAEGWSVDFRCSQAVRSYLAQNTKVNMATITRSPGVAVDLVLLDDPPTVANVRSALSDAEADAKVGLIAGFDPLQWREKYLSSSLTGLDDVGEMFKLTTCYRQSDALVDLARELASTINDRSSWRSAKKPVEEEREMLRQLQAEYLDELQTIKPGGRAMRYEASIGKAVNRESGLLRARNDLWDTMPALLVLEDRAHGATMTKKWAEAVQGIKRLTRDLTDVASYKGLDFQAVWIFLEREYYERIQTGGLGLSKVEWEALRDLHIPLTRAKDSTVLFVV